MGMNCNTSRPTSEDTLQLLFAKLWNPVYALGRRKSAGHITTPANNDILPASLSLTTFGSRITALLRESSSKVLGRALRDPLAQTLFHPLIWSFALEPHTTTKSRNITWGWISNSSQRSTWLRKGYDGSCSLLIQSSLHLLNVSFEKLYRSSVYCGNAKSHRSV